MKLIYLFLLLIPSALFSQTQPIEMMVEIPAGTIEKYEVNKTTGLIEQDSVDGKPRVIDYLGYPGNYGYIKGTLLSKSDGGDGDPLDVILLSGSVSKGTILEIIPIGVLRLKDNGESDDKILAVPLGHPKNNLQNLNTFEELMAKYPSIAEIIKSWFLNYKGKGKTKFLGWEDEVFALDLIDASRVD
ncbi:inorganic diphosphatase [Marinigracilibium pacificum]|uniref:inorganic diphosphatase n=1 Tax=Marinigracilibium pacificum TaxID=2729599 RepID=A0A848J2M8_9BACT|nr:inorganic diphosphatase [Marinigracilibium pacificum]NMM49981.1 inorganic diphosphatase [Marinigracilibium pacificum]